MNGFIDRTYANLTNYKLTGFTVEGIAGRNPGGEPRWNVSCTRCGHLLILPHSRLVRLIEARQTQINNLQCGNGACPASRVTSDTETFEQFRRRERRESEAAAAQQRDAQRAIDAKAATKRAADAQRLALQRDWIRFWRQQLLAGTPKILSRQRWESLPAETRERILDRIAADPTLQVSESE